MKFVHCINSPDNNPPVRAYLHETGSGHYAEPSWQDQQAQARSAEAYLKETFAKKALLPLELNYILAVMWASENGEKIIDCFGYYGVQEFPGWPGNPWVRVWTLEDGCYNPELAMGCADTMLMLGQEETHRRACRTLDEYLRNPPKLHDVSRVPTSLH